MPRCHVTKVGEESRLGNDTAAVAQNGFADDRSDLEAIERECRIHTLAMIPSGYDSVRVLPLPQTRCPRFGCWRHQLGCARSVADKHVVVPAVIVAFEFQELRTAGRSTRQTQRDLNDLRPAVRKTHQIGTGYQPLDDFSYFVFEIVLRSERGTRSSAIRTASLIAGWQ